MLSNSLHKNFNFCLCSLVVFTGLWLLLGGIFIKQIIHREQNLVHKDFWAMLYIFTY